MAAKQARVRAPKAVRLSFREKTDLENLPDRIAALSGEIAALEARIADPGLFARDKTVFEAAVVRLDAAKSEIGRAEERWLEVEIKREALRDASG